MRELAFKQLLLVGSSEDFVISIASQIALCLMMLRPPPNDRHALRVTYAGSKDLAGSSGSDACTSGTAPISQPKKQPSWTGPHSSNARLDALLLAELDQFTAGQSAKGVVVTMDAKQQPAAPLQAHGMRGPIVAIKGAPVSAAVDELLVDAPQDDGDNSIVLLSAKMMEGNAALAFTVFGAASGY